MSDMPERIWATPENNWWSLNMETTIKQTEYIKIDKYRELESENKQLIEMLQQVYLTDDEGSSQFIELQKKVSGCLFNNMGWSGDENNFANWQESNIED